MRIIGRQSALALVTLALMSPPSAWGQEATRQLPEGTRILQKPALAPAPTVTDWSPREQAYPGQTLVIRGQDFRPDDFVIRLGSGTRSITLAIVAAKPLEIQARIPAEYTGWAGAPLTVYHRRGEVRTLDQDYRVLNRDARFSGPSLWHLTDSGNSDVFTRGRVSVRLENFEFAESGAGTYSETVDFVREVRSFEEECKDSNGLPGTREVKVYKFRTKRPNRRIEWRKLPDGRVELRGIGPEHGRDPEAHTGLATIDRQVLRLQYETATAGMHSVAETRRGHCYGDFDLKGMAPPTGTSRVIGVPFRLVEWSLARSAGT